MIVRDSPFWAGPSCGVYERPRGIRWCGPYNDAVVLDELVRVLAIECVRSGSRAAQWLSIEDLFMLMSEP